MPPLPGLRKDVRIENPAFPRGATILPPLPGLLRSEKPLNAPFDIEIIPAILDHSYRNTALSGEMRFLTHFLTGGNETRTDIALAWLNTNHEIALSDVKANHEDAQHVLSVFAKLWPATPPRFTLKPTTKLNSVATMMCPPVIFANSRNASANGLTNTPIISTGIIIGHM